MVRKILLLLILTNILACKNEKPPADILSEDKMVKLLIDIHIAEAKVNQIKFVSRDSSEAVYKALENKILKKYKITEKTYLKSYDYYNSRPDKMDNIYSIVVDSLSLRQKILKLN